MKGCSSKMLKVGAKRRRTKQEIVEQTVAEAMREQLSQELQEETNHLKQQLIQKEQQLASNEAAG